MCNAVALEVQLPPQSEVWRPGRGLRWRCELHNEESCGLWSLHETLHQR